MDIHSSRHPSHPTAFLPVVPSIEESPKTPEPAAQPSTKSNLRSVLKTILLKDYYSPEPDPRGPSATPASRPPMKRMKDSDDYITARGANPRTGLISPSVGTRTPCTPDSPGDALKLRKLHVSPTSVVVEAKAPSKANQGRKISAGEPRRWHEDELPVEVGAFISSDDELYDDRRSVCSVPKDDQLVHMPSADEPQPFSYPGYSEEQIKAFEHYKHKARRTSSDGYDRRLKKVSGKLASVPGAFESYEVLVDADDEASIVAHPLQGKHFKPYRHRHLHQTPSHHGHQSISVRKRSDLNARPTTKFAEPLCAAKAPAVGAKSTALLSPAFTSPKTRAIDRLSVEERRVPNNVPKKACRDANICAQQEICCSAPEQISRKAIGSAPRPLSVTKRLRDDYGGDPYVVSTAHNTHGMIRDETLDDLSRLPRVRLVRRSEEDDECQYLRTRHEREDCSFGCQQDLDDRQCLDCRKTSTGTVIRRKSYVHDTTDGTAEQPSTEHAEIALGILYTILAYFQAMRLPKSTQIETLMSPDASRREKAEALKAVLSMTAHAVAACTILAMLWKLGVMAMHLLEILLWPLAVPLRVLRWVALSVG